MNIAINPNKMTITEADVRPLHSLDLLSHRELQQLFQANADIYQQFRQCALAVLNTGSEIDDAEAMLDHYKDFDIQVVQQSRGLKLKVFNAPATAFVDGVMIRGIQDHLFAVLRDVVYTYNKMSCSNSFDLSNSAGITDAVFRILRNAKLVKPNQSPDLTVCWGGHSISRKEYDFSKHVGYELGLRGINIATGCGLGAMKGPMKGATIGHAKQQIRNGRYIGISEPGIIASESPNPIVNELVILPDIEKRLEAFVRLAHCIIVFPGGAGTAEEILYLLGILLHEKNRHMVFPVIFAAPETSKDYFVAMDNFIRKTLGDEATRLYQIVVGDTEAVARAARAGIDRVHAHRREGQEAYYFNWPLHIPADMQEPFEPSHENMRNLALNYEQPIGLRASQLRRAFSGIVAGNVKAFGVAQIKKHGPFQLQGDPTIIHEMDSLLRSFVEQRRMKLGSDTYKPCYELVKP